MNNTKYNNGYVTGLKEGYRKGFFDHANLDPSNGKISLLGYDIIKLLDIIGEYEMTDKPKAKMTRAEAIASLQKHCPVDDPAGIIDFYIEAGMLEIVEENLSGLPIGFQFPFSEHKALEKFINELNKQGFIIIKKS